LFQRVSHLRQVTVTHRLPFSKY